MPRVLLNFDHRIVGYAVHFIEADCHTLIGAKTRYFTFPDDDALRDFVKRCSIEEIEDFEISLRAWGRGSNFVQLTDEQYAKLK